MSGSFPFRLISSIFRKDSRTSVSTDNINQSIFDEMIDCLLLPIFEWKRSQDPLLRLSDIFGSQRRFLVEHIEAEDQLDFNVYLERTSNLFYFAKDIISSLPISCWSEYPIFLNEARNFVLVLYSTYRMNCVFVQENWSDQLVTQSFPDPREYISRVEIIKEDQLLSFLDELTCNLISTALKWNRSPAKNFMSILLRLEKNGDLRKKQIKFLIEKSFDEFSLLNDYLSIRILSHFTHYFDEENWHDVFHRLTAVFLKRPRIFNSFYSHAFRVDQMHPGRIMETFMNQINFEVTPTEFMKYIPKLFVTLLHNHSETAKKALRYLDNLYVQVLDKSKHRHEAEMYLIQYLLLTVGLRDEEPIREMKSVDLNHNYWRLPLPSLSELDEMEILRQKLFSENSHEIIRHLSERERRMTEKTQESETMDWGSNSSLFIEDDKKDENELPSQRSLTSTINLLHKDNEKNLEKCTTSAFPHHLKQVVRRLVDDVYPQSALVYSLIPMKLIDYLTEENETFYNNILEKLLRNENINLQLIPLMPIISTIIDNIIFHETLMNLLVILQAFYNSDNVEELPIFYSNTSFHLLIDEWKEKRAIDHFVQILPYSPSIDLVRSIIQQIIHFAHLIFLRKRKNTFNYFQTLYQSPNYLIHQIDIWLFIDILLKIFFSAPYIRYKKEIDSILKKKSSIQLFPNEPPLSTINDDIYITYELFHNKQWTDELHLMEWRHRSNFIEIFLSLIPFAHFDQLSSIEEGIALQFLYDPIVHIHRLSVKLVANLLLRYQLTSIYSSHSVRLVEKVKELNPDKFEVTLLNIAIEFLSPSLNYHQINDEDVPVFLSDDDCPILNYYETFRLIIGTSRRSHRLNLVKQFSKYETIDSLHSPHIVQLNQFERLKHFHQLFYKNFISLIFQPNINHQITINLVRLIEIVTRFIHEMMDSRQFYQTPIEYYQSSNKDEDDYQKNMSFLLHMYKSITETYGDRILTLLTTIEKSNQLFLIPIIKRIYQRYGIF